MVLRHLSLSLFMVALAGAETLHVLVLEIDHRYTAPAYERAIGGNPAAFEEAVSKLRKLTPEQGVREWIHLEIPRDDPEKRITTGQMRYQDTPREKKRTELGHEHVWFRSANGLVSRNLELNAQLDKLRLLRLRTQFHHRIDDQWSLSAALSGPKGTILVLEKLVDGKTTPKPASWVFQVLREKEPGRMGRASVEQDLIKSPLNRAALLRVPDPETTIASVASLDLARDTDYMEGYSKDLVSFNATAASENKRLKLKYPIRGTVRMERLVDVGMKSTVSHHGEHTVPLKEPAAGEEFEVLQRNNQREGQTTRSVPSGKKSKYYLDCRLITRG